MGIRPAILPGIAATCCRQGPSVRIVAVADVVEAMTRHRPHRPALGLERALAEIRDGASIKYDADVVQTCLTVFSEGYVFPENTWER